MTKSIDKIVIIVGDIHGAWDDVNKIMVKEPTNLYLSTGDTADVNFEYATLSHPLWAIPGNHENWDIVENYKHNAGRIGNLNFIFPGKIYNQNNIRYGGMGRNFSPEYFFYHREDLPFPKNKDGRNGKADRRRHFVQEEVELCKEKLFGLDILLTHESPSFYEKYMRFSDNGSGEVIDDLVKTVKPKLHLWGHHHEYYSGYVENILSIGMPYPREAYLKINLMEKKLYLIDTENGGVKDEKSLC